MARCTARNGGGWRCPNEAGEEFKFCERCRRWGRESVALHYIKNRRKCIRKAAERTRKRRNRMKEFGLCRRCGKEKDRDGYYCVKCKERQNENSREHRQGWNQIKYLQSLAREKHVYQSV